MKNYFVVLSILTVCAGFAPVAMAGNVNIEGVDKAKLIQALYKRAKVQGLGWMAGGPKEISLEEAQKLVGEYIDYLHGKVMKIRIEEDATEVDDWGYDRDNGSGAVKQVVEALRGNSADSIPAKKADSKDLLLPASKGLLLKNGQSEALPTVLTIFANLKTVFTTNPIAAYELVQKCKDNNHKYFGNTQKVLENFSLVEADGSISTSVKNIVLSSIEGEDLDMVLSSPLKEQTE